MFLGSNSIMSTPTILFETRWLSVQRIGHWDFVRRPQADASVGILAITAELEIILVEQFRIPIQRRVIEIPAGLVGDEPAHLGESLAGTAARELLEETGYRAGTIEPLIATPTSAGLTAEFIHLFYATDLTQEHVGGGIGSEDIIVHRVLLTHLRTWLREQEAAGLVIDFKIHASLWLAGL